MKLIVGLGNPGKEYENSRHNSGWMVLEALTSELGFENLKKETKFKAKVSQGTFKGEKIILAEPVTFMNLSGLAVQSLMHFYKIKPRDLWVIYDDLDLPLGQIRIRKTGSAGTHNGMKSIVTEIADINFPRIRIGIESRGVTSAVQQDTSSFVLNGFTAEEKPLALQGRNSAVKAIITALIEDLETAMNTFNKQDNT